MTIPDRRIAEHIAANVNVEVLPTIRTRRDLEDHPLDLFEPLDVDQLLAAHRHLTERAEQHTGEIRTRAEVSTIDDAGREVMVDLDGSHDPQVWANAALVCVVEYLALAEAAREAVDQFIAIHACAQQADQEVPVP